MPNFLIIGDCHVEVNTIPECERLIDLIDQKSKEADAIIFLGDQFHNHSIVNVEVMEFWKNAFSYLNKPVYCLVGNHDRPNDANSKAHVFTFLNNEKITVIHDYDVIHDILFIGYKFKKDDFLEICNKYKNIKTVIAHQTFFGARFENGFLALEKESIDANLVPQEYILSGHIHTEQEFNKVHYLGSPRWRTLSDANIDKFIWLVCFENGVPTKKIKYSTSPICKKILTFKDVEGIPLENIGNTDNCAVYIDVYGTQGYINLRREEFKAKGWSVRPFIVNEKEIKVKESNGINKTILEYFDNFKIQYGSSKEDLKKLIMENIIGI